jgi:hypothetical protein
VLIIQNKNEVQTWIILCFLFFRIIGTIWGFCEHIRSLVLQQKGKKHYEKIITDHFLLMLEVECRYYIMSFKNSSGYPKEKRRILLWVDGLGRLEEGMWRRL